MSGPVSFHSIRELHAALAEGTTTVGAVTAHYLDAADSRPELRAYLSVFRSDAKAAAAVADEILSQQKDRAAFLSSRPVFGVPMAIKDNIHVRGFPTTCASRLLEGFVAPFDATAARRLLDSGAVMIGKTNLDEFAMGGSGENSAFGRTLHPTHPDRVPGGSSSGSAVAVAAGLALGALGSDTGGSIRLPAAFCGIAGLKPTYGRVSRRGLVAFASSLDQIGPMAHQVDDLIRIFDAIHGHDELDATSAQVARAAITRESLLNGRKIRIGVPEEFFGEGLQRETRAAIDTILSRLAAKGAELVPLRLPNLTHAVSVYYVIAMAEASSNLSRYDGVRFGVRNSLQGPATIERFYAGNRALFGSEAKRRILLGTFLLSAGWQEAYYLQACRVRRLISEDFTKAFREVDLIAGPVAPTTAFPSGSHDRDPVQMYLNDLYTIPANLAGLPALSVPVGTDSEGLPIGMQLIAPAFSEELLLRAGLDVEVVR